MFNIRDLKSNSRNLPTKSLECYKFTPNRYCWGKKWECSIHSC